MGIYSNIIIKPQTAADTQGFFLERNDLPARVTVSGLAGSETATLSALDGPLGAQVTTAVFKDGVAVVFSATNPVQIIDAPGQYVLAKSVTASASGAYLAKG